jgi:hypothetical protein
MTLENIGCDVTVTGFDVLKIDLILKNKNQDKIRCSSKQVGDYESTASPNRAFVHRDTSKPRKVTGAESGGPTNV